MIKELIKISNKLDLIGLTKEADELDGIIRKMSQARVDIDPDQISVEPGDDHPLSESVNSSSYKSPEQRLLDRIFAVDKIMQLGLGNKSPEEIAKHFGFGGAKDRDIVDVIRTFMGSRLYR